MKLKNCLLSIDWDYFVHTRGIFWGSYTENPRNIIDIWYRRYIKEKSQGKDLHEFFRLCGTNTFWKKINEHFIFSKTAKAYISDSHALSYDIAKKHQCDVVYLFDAHADLGYGGLTSLDFEVNCANWLGKLLKDRIADEANIIYSPFTSEKPEYFRSINEAFNVRYLKFSDLGRKIRVSVVHICRSGAWTPPWFDEKFFQFVKNSGMEHMIVNCPERKWDVENLNLSDQIFYSMA